MWYHGTEVSKMFDFGGSGHCTMSHRYDEAPRQEYYFRHSHTGYELLYFLSGDAEYNVEGRVFRLRPHDLLLIQPAHYHYLRPLSGAPYERYCSNFEGRILPGEGGRLATLPAVTNIADRPRLRACFEKLEEYAHRFGEADMQLAVRLAVREILLLLLYDRPQEEPDRARHNPIVDRIVALVDARPEGDWTAATLAKALYLSPSYIQNTFSRYMDIGLKQYINHKKILHAQALLLAGEKAGDVCERCGFRDYSTFFRLYRRLTGTTPGAAKED